MSQILRDRGYEHLVLQVGKGSVVPTSDSCPHISLEAYRFKTSIADDIEQADLVISHAGEYNVNSLRINHSVFEDGYT